MAPRYRAWGSTSTTAVRPARRIGTAAAESSVAARGLQLLQGFESIGEVGAGDDDADEVLKRRIAERAAALELAVEKALDVMPCGVRDRARVGLERLHDHAPRRIAPAPARELRQQLERALLGAKIGQPEPHVGIDEIGR